MMSWKVSIKYHLDLKSKSPFEQSQLELEHLAKSQKKEQIEMEMKAFELEDSSSEVSEKVAESNSTGVSQPISKIATDRTNDWVDSVSSQAPPDVASAPDLLAFTPVPISSEPTISAKLAHAIHTSNGHNHGYTALSDAGIHSHGHRVMPQFGSASLLPLQASAPSVLVPVNNMHSSANVSGAHVLPPPSAVPLQTMSSNITNNDFANGQPESLPVPILPAQTGSGFVSLSPAFAGGDFSSSGVNPPPVFLSAPYCHAAPVHTQNNVPFLSHTVSPNNNDYYTSDANLWRLAATTPIVTPVQCCNAGGIFSNVTTVVPPCNTAAPYTSGGTVYFNSPPVHPQHFPHFVNYSNTGYQPVTEDYAPSSAYPNQVCSSDRPLSAVNWRIY